MNTIYYSFLIRPYSADEEEEVDADDEDEEELEEGEVVSVSDEYEESSDEEEEDDEWVWSFQGFIILISSFLALQWACRMRSECGSCRAPARGTWRGMGLGWVKLQSY